jgi:hypothetical protein
VSAQRNGPSHTPTRSRLRGSGALPNQAPCAGRDVRDTSGLRVRWRVGSTQQTIAHPKALTAPRQRSPTSEYHARALDRATLQPSKPTLLSLGFDEHIAIYHDSSRHFVSDDETLIAEIYQVPIPLW